MSPVLAETHAVPSSNPPGTPEPGPARRDLLDLETLPKADLVRLLEGAAAFRRVLATPSRKKAVLTGTAVANVFFEASTRTRVSFEWAAKRVGVYSNSASSFGRPQISRPPLSDCSSST